MALTNTNIEKGVQIKDVYHPEYGIFRVVGAQEGTNFWIIENRAGSRLLDPADFDRYEIVKK